MSRSGDSPQTPRNKDSSSSLLATFRSLTGGSKARSPSNVTPSATPPVSSTSNPFDLPPGVTSQEHLDKDAADTLRAVSELHGQSTPIKPRGPPGLRSLLGDLRADKTLAQRISAAKAVTKLLNQYADADVQQIWAVGKDLLNVESRDALVAAHELLDACVCHKTSAPVEKRLFFHSISDDADSKLLGMRITILNHLTSSGRDIADLGQNFMGFLVRLLKNSHAAAKPSRKAKKLAGNQNGPLSEEEVHLQKVFDYILNIIKYNSKAFTEIEIDLLINTMYPLAQLATAVPDLLQTTNIIDALITYSCLPATSLTACVELLCGIYAQIDELRGVTWRTVEHLLGSHLGPATINAIIHIIKNPPDRRNHGRARGACQVVQRILASDEVEDPPQIVMPKLVSACRQSLAGADSTRLELEIIRLLLKLCEGDDPATVIFNEKVWTNIEDIVKHCAKRIEPSVEPTSGFNTPTDDRSSTANAARTETEALQQDAIRLLAKRLEAMSADGNAEQRLQVMRLLMAVGSLLDDEQALLLVDFYSTSCLMYTSHDEWPNDCHMLMQGLFTDYTRSVPVRRRALEALRDAHATAEALNAPFVGIVLSSILHCISPEPEPTVVEDLCQVAVTAGTDTADKTRFESIIDSLKVALHDGVASGHVSNVAFATFAQRMGFATDKTHDTLTTSIAKTIVRIFLRTVHNSAWKAHMLFMTMLSIARSGQYPAEARVIVLKLLFRLRAESNHTIFIVSATECDDIAAMLCRTADTALDNPKGHESPIIRASRAEEQVARKSNSATSKLPSRTTTSNGRATHSSSRMSRPTPPLWLYPGPKGLPEEPSVKSSRLLTSKRGDPNEADEDDGRTFLQMGLWLELLLDILQQDELEWEVYSYVLVHLGAQLTNHALFTDAIPQVQMLRSVICGQLATRNFHEPPSFTGLKRSDAAMCLYHVLTILISYRRHFSKNEEDDIVRMFSGGIGSWERTSEVCIHALSVCCHELPGSLSKVLEGTLHRMTQIITQAQVAVHVLEFLAALARLPELYRNFREEEFKIVFGICFRYLQDARDSRLKTVERNSMRMSNPATRPSSMAKEQTLGSRPTSVAGSAVADDLPQYVYALAYHVMTFWFMSLKMPDRHKHVAWISRNLLHTDANGKEVMEEQAQVTIDMMQRVAFSDRDETRPDPYFAKEQDGIRATKSWVVGKSIVTIETAGRTGHSQIIRRRPTGTTYSTFRPSIVKPPRHQAPITIGSAAEAFFTDDYVGILPDHVFQEFYAFQDHITGTFSFELPNEDAIQRALNTFDRIDPLDGHKVGIIYVGEDQTSEAMILSNVMGSADYTSFLGRIGTLIQLRDAPMNTQGLDRSETETDGEYTFAWRDRVSELVFHVTTMMPNHEHDTNRTLKKRHIGNDYVNIIFNNSGKSWNIDNIPSDFNIVNIVISPEARASFVETRLNASAALAEQAARDQSRPVSPGPESAAAKSNPYARLYYKVTVLTKPGIPAMSPAHITKIVSGASLPAFVRLLALNASTFAQVWANRDTSGGIGEYPSSWRSRLKEITKLRERYGPSETPVVEGRESRIDSVITNATSQPKTNSIQSLSSTLSAPRESSFFPRRASKPNILSFETTDADRVGSSGSAR